MNDRDTLIELLTRADMQRNDWDQSTYEAQADGLLAAGWRPPPRTHDIPCDRAGGTIVYE